MTITIPTKPDNFRWGYSNIGDTSIINKPSNPKMASGWDLVNEIPTRQDTNWLFYNIGEWTQYLSSGGASIMYLATDDPDIVISSIEGIDISSVESGSWLYTISGVFTFYPDIPSPANSSEYAVKPTTPLIGNLGVWLLTIPSMDTMNGLTQEEIDRVELKVDEHISNTETELDNINGKLGNVVSTLTAVATPDSAFTSISNHDSQTQTFTITGLDNTKYYDVGLTPLSGLQDGLNFYGWVSATDTISVKIINSSNGSLTPTAQSWKFVITE